MATQRHREKGGLVSQAYEQLKKKIITLELQPGEFLNEKQLMEEFGVGRTPLRESILRLKAEGLVEGEPNKSSYVKDISLQSTKDILEALGVVEKSIMLLAAQRATPAHIKKLRAIQARVEDAIKKDETWSLNINNYDFHDVIGQASGNRVLQEVNQNLRNKAMRLSYLATTQKTSGIPDTVDYNSQIIEQHRAMIDLLERHDIAGVEELCLAHLTLFRNRIFRFLSNADYGF